MEQLKSDYYEFAGGQIKITNIAILQRTDTKRKLLQNIKERICIIQEHFCEMKNLKHHIN